MPAIKSNRHQSSNRKQNNRRRPLVFFLVVVLPIIIRDHLALIIYDVSAGVGLPKRAHSYEWTAMTDVLCSVVKGAH
jgi:hypothetical protein